MANAIATFVPIIVIIIGSLAPFLTGTIYNQFYNKPNVDIMIKPSDNIRQSDNMTNMTSIETSIEITNTGIVPATNLTLTIDASTTIKTITIDLATDDIRLKNANNTIDLGKTQNVTSESVQLTISRLAPGKGSITRINSIIEYNDTYIYPKDYNVYATYDQGSAVGLLLEKSQQEEILEIISSLSENVFLGNEYFLWTYYVIFWISFFIWYLLWLKRNKKKKYIANIMYEIISARSTLKNIVVQQIYYLIAGKDVINGLLLIMSRDWRRNILYFRKYTYIKGNWMELIMYELMIFIKNWLNATLLSKNQFQIVVSYYLLMMSAFT
jgi:hypothetical protein